MGMKSGFSSIEKNECSLNKGLFLVPDDEPDGLLAKPVRKTRKKKESAEKPRLNLPALFSKAPACYASSKRDERFQRLRRKKKEE